MNWILENWGFILTVVGVSLGILGFVAAKIDSVKKELTEAKDKMYAVALIIKAARDEASPSGKKLSTEEAKDLVAAVADAIAELVDVGESIGDVMKDIKDRKKK